LAAGVPVDGATSRVVLHVNLRVIAISLWPRSSETFDTIGIDASCEGSSGNKARDIEAKV
jgi:hypothetical protein